MTQDQQRVILVLTEAKRTNQKRMVWEENKRVQKVIYKWKVSLFDLHGKEKRDLGTFVSRVDYVLHPTFPQPFQTKTQSPFALNEEGYGSFDLEIKVVFKDAKLEPLLISHPIILNPGTYEMQYQTEWPDELSPEFVALLNQTPEKKRETGKKEGKEMLYGLDIDQVSDRLYQLKGQQILKVVEFIKQAQKNEQEVYVYENDQEFHFDLYTLSEKSLHDLWTFIQTV